MTPAHPSPAEPIDSPEDLRQADTLYRLAFGYADPAYGINPRLLRSLRVNGGSVVGARDTDGTLVAFSYGFLGTDGHHTYHYSQAAVVHPDHQGRGLGRALKLAQREVALSWGTTTMRWSYDPALARNAHFNLDVLGATGRSFHRDFFDVPGSHRVIVEWDLTRDPGRPGDTPEPPPGIEGEPHWACPVAVSATRTWLPLPSDIGRIDAADATRAATLRARIADAVERLIDGGAHAVECRRLSEGTSAYRFERTAPGEVSRQ